MNEPALTAVLPPGWPRPKGYSNAWRVPAGHDLVVLAGQVGWDEREQLVGPGFAEQFEQALRNCVTLVRAAGGRHDHIVRLTIFCADKQAYVDDLAEVGSRYRSVMGRHFPAMSLVEVAALLEPGALVEIEALAAIPPEAT